MLETDADRLAYLEAFGVSVRIRGQELLAIFDNDYLAVQAIDMGVQSSTPYLTCRSADVERVGPRKGDSVDGLAKAFVVERSEPDGTGMTRIVLAEP